MLFFFGYNIDDIMIYFIINDDVITLLGPLRIPLYVIHLMSSSHITIYGISSFVLNHFISILGGYVDKISITSSGVRNT